VRRPLYGWLAAELVTLTGTRVSMVALPLLVLLSTGSAVDTGLVALAETLPLVLMKVLAGPVIDRVGARRVSVSCNLASLPVVAAIPLLYDAGHLGLPGLLVLVAIAGALRGPADAGTYALLPTLVHEAGVPMERATGLHSVAERTASMGGAALAGVLVVAAGPANALLLDAASFGVAALVLLWATAGLPESVQPVEDDDATDLPYLQRLREGWQFLRSDPVLLGITVMVSITNLLDAAWTAVLMPVWAVETGSGAGALGLLYAVFSGAAVLGALCAATFADRLPRYWIYLIGFMVAGIPRFVAVALDAPLVVLAAVFVAGGFAAGFLNPILGAVMFERIPARFTGRVTALSVAASWSLLPFGGLLGGVLVHASGLTVALVIVGIAYFAATTLPALDPRWREIDRRPGQDGDGMAPSGGSVGTSTETVSG
jgi:MFS family permease